MNIELRETPMKVLIAEDQEKLRGNCCFFLQKRFPRLRLDQAETVEKAENFIQESFREQSPYDCVILDLKLPKTQGEYQKTGTSLGEYLIRFFGGLPTPILQWTAYPEDEAISRFQENPRLMELGVSYQVISKRDVDWPTRMLEYFDRLTAEKTLGSVLDDPYFTSQHKGQLLLCGGAAAAGGPPVSIPSFVQALIGAWCLLSDFRRNQALLAFRNSVWALEERDGEVSLIHARARQAMAEAAENAAYLEALESNP